MGASGKLAFTLSLSLAIMGISGVATAQTPVPFVGGEATYGVEAVYVNDFSRDLLGWPSGATRLTTSGATFKLKWHVWAPEAHLYRLWTSDSAVARARVSKTSGFVDMGIRYTISGCGAPLQQIEQPRVQLKSPIPEAIDTTIDWYSVLPRGLNIACTTSGWIDLVVSLVINTGAPVQVTLSSFGVLGRPSIGAEDYVFGFYPVAPPPACERSTEPFYWSCYRELPNMWCIPIWNPYDPDGWGDNFLCSTQNLGVTWRMLGVEPPPADQWCTQIRESLEPRAWLGNYLCVPRTSSYRFTWSESGPIAGKHCLGWIEPADPNGWNDNYLCWGSIPTCPAGQKDCSIDPSPGHIPHCTDQQNYCCGGYGCEQPCQRGPNGRSVCP